MTVTSDGTSIKVYINGELANSFTGTTSHKGNIFFGDSKFDGRFFKGEIDEIYVYNRALSEAEINLLYKMDATPIANAGPDQTANEGDLVTLDGSASTDPDNDALTYKWKAPEEITLSSETDVKPTFTAPDVTIDTEFKFSLIVNDGIVDSPADEVIILVKDVKCQQHFHTVWENTNGIDHMNINIIEVQIDGLNLEPGDEIGVFDGERCVGYAKLQKIIDRQNLLQIKVSRDEGTGNGYIIGHEISFKLWDCSNATEMNVIDKQCFNIQYEPVQCSPFEIGATSYVELSVRNQMCHTTQFKTGWNIYSAPCQPEHASAISVFQELINYNSLVKIQDETGNSLENWGIFGGWKDNIGNISPTDGYKVKVNNNESMEVCGIPVRYPYPIELMEGWNIMGYPQTTAFDALEVVKQLINRKTLIKVQDEAGNSIEDWGIFGGWQNNIINFVPGKGYKIKVNSNDILLVNDNYPKSTLILPEVTATNHFKPAFEGNGLDHMNINLLGLPVNILQSGDELAIFDGTTCVGAVSILPRNMQSQTVSIAVSAKDNQGMPGFAEGNSFVLKLWNSKQNQEFILEPDIVKGTSTFTRKETTVASLEKYNSTGLEGLPDSNNSEINCYPNPFGNFIRIENHEKVTRLKITNVLGQTVIDSENPQHFTNTEKLTDGVYFITLFGKDDVSKSVKMIKNSR